MKDQITMTELAKRWNITRQGAAKLAREADDFPPTTKQGNRVLVSWKAAQKWRKQRDKTRAVSQAQTAHKARIRHLRGQLYQHALVLFGPRDAYLVLRDIHTVDACYTKAKEWRLTLTDLLTTERKTS